MGKSSKAAAAAAPAPAAPVSAAAKSNASKKSEKKGKKVVEGEVIPVAAAPKVCPFLYFPLWHR